MLFIRHPNSYFLNPEKKVINPIGIIIKPIIGIEVREATPKKAIIIPKVLRPIK